jgi:glycosyltransferase involved in cell wall biosynthesis
MKKVLILSYYFPPVGGGGVQRTSKFVKYLPANGWLPFVLTVKEDVYRKIHRSIDATLLDEIPDDAVICRTGSFDLSAYSRGEGKGDGGSRRKSPRTGFVNQILGLVINPDSQMFWIPFAVLRGLGLIRRKKIDVIYATGNPWSNLIAGIVLSKLGRCPCVCDFRDPWTLNPFYSYSSKLRRAIHEFLEKKVFEISRRIMVTSNETEDDYRAVFNTDKLVTITNGFDEDDFAGVQPLAGSGFTFLYAGNVLNDFKRPVTLISAINIFLKKNPRAKKEFRIHFLGSIDDQFKQMVEEADLQHAVKFLGYRPHKESIAMMLGARVLLLARSEVGKMIIPGKVFEYFVSGKPILALIPPDGAAANILKKEGREAFIVSPGDIEGIAAKIEMLYVLYRKKALPSYRTENLEKYTRRKLAARFAEILDEICGCS